MPRTTLVLLALVAGASAWGTAPAAAATTQDKLALLGGYSTALGRKFGCDSNTDAMVNAIKKYTYVLQFDDADETSASDIAKKNLTAGINETKSNHASCPSTAQGVTDLEEQLRTNRPLMEEAMKTVATVAGAAVACDVPKEQVEHAITPAIAFTETSGDEYSEKLTAWAREGISEVNSKQIDCETAKKIFDQVADIFAH